MKSFLKIKKGQALIETMLISPLLIILIIGIGYFGCAITVQHNLTVAARYSARMVSMESTKSPLDRTEGTFILKVNEAMFKNYAMQSVPQLDGRRLEAKPLSIGFIASNGLTPVLGGSGYVFLYKTTGNVSANSTNKDGKTVSDLRNMEVGMGALFFGVRLTYQLKELNWMAKLIGLKEGVTLQGISLMPAEIPLRGLANSGYGLIDMNSGIFKIITTNVRSDSAAKSHDYSNLIKD